MNKALIREIFLSIQGEGPYVGEEQLFIRFCGCNLCCNYCDTDFEASKAEEFTPQELIEKVNSYGKNLVLSLTGGEPLVSVKFLKEFLPLAKFYGHKVYLETNGTLPDALAEIINLIDIVSADIKLESASGVPFAPQIYEQFFKKASEKEVFAKLVFNRNITQEEINFALQLASKYDFEIILQPEMSGNNFNISTSEMEEVFGKFRSKYRKVRLIPQMHKFIEVR